jgi:hypothetical protein
MRRKLKSSTPYDQRDAHIFIGVMVAVVLLVLAATYWTF